MTEQEINDIVEGRWTHGQIASFERAHESLSRSLNIYQRLEAKGWKRTSGNSRLDFYKKGRWMVVVPASTLGRVRFYEFQGEIYHLRTK